MKRRRYFIEIQIRTAYNGGDPASWCSYRTIARWPKLFCTRRDAEAFMETCFTFANIPGRKHSASVMSTTVIR